MDALSDQARRKLSLRITDKEHEQLKQEAQDYGYDFSTLLRLKIFGTLKGMRITRRPSADMMLLGSLIGKLSAISAELNKNGSNINQIAKRLNQGGRDVFGLDGALKRLESTQDNLLRILNQVEAAISGRQKSRLDINQ